MDAAELKLLLRAKLSQSLEETVDTMFDAATSAKEDRSNRLHEQDFDVFHACCKKLVTFIQDHMETSTDFAQQMERIIQACFTNSSPQALRSLVTKDIWINAPPQQPGSARASSRHNMKLPELTSSNAGPGAGGGPNAISSTSSSTKRRPLTPPAPVSSGPHVSTRSSAKKRKQSSPPVMRTTRSSATKRQPVSRATRSTATARQLKEVDYETVSDSSDEEPRPAKKPAVERAKRTSRVPASHKLQEPDSPERESSPEPDRLPLMPAATISRNITGAPDVIGDMCYPDRRTSAQTKFFKERLRKAIEFVDAQMCRPPMNRRCGRECAFIRGQMCNQDKACKNRLCRLWHEVEAHSSSCENSHCEFRNRIMQRESRHKIELKERKVAILKQTVREKQQELENLKHDSISEREKHIETILLSNELEELGRDVEKEMEELNTMELQYRGITATLEEIGVFPEDDEKDKLLDFDDHYVDNKTPTKKKPGRKKREWEEEEDTINNGPSGHENGSAEDEQEEKHPSPSRFQSPPRKPSGQSRIIEDEEEEEDVEDENEQQTSLEQAQKEDTNKEQGFVFTEDSTEGAKDQDEVEAEQQQTPSKNAQSKPDSEEDNQEVRVADDGEGDPSTSRDGTKDPVSNAVPTTSKTEFRKSGADLEKLMNKENEVNTTSPMEEN